MSSTGNWLGLYEGDWLGNVGATDPNAMYGSASFSISVTGTLTSAADLNAMYGSTSFSFDATGDLTYTGQEKSSFELVRGWIKDKKRKEIDPPSALEIEAERIKLGIIEDNKEIKRVTRLLKQVEVPATRTQSSLEASKLAIHKKLLAERIKRANDEYEALLRRINENYLRARVEAHKAIKRQREEDDVIYVMSMLASM